MGCDVADSLIISKLPSLEIKSVLARMTPGRGLSPAPEDEPTEGGDWPLLPGEPTELIIDWGDWGTESGDGGSDISEHSDSAP